jgi:hypothetical protein
MSLLDDIKDLPVSKWGMLSPPIITNEVVTAARRARQFVFSQQASLRVGELMRDNIGMFADNLEFAIPPYDPCYIEVDLDAMYSVLKKDLPPDPTADKNVGFLFVGNQIYSLVNSHAKPQANLAMYGTYFKSGETRPNALRSEEPALKEVYPWLLMGSSFDHLNTAQRQRFIDTFGIMCTLRPEIYAQLNDHQRRPNFAGEARTIAVILLMLYNKKHVVLTDKPFERRITKNGMRTYMAHTTVEISLTDPVELRRSTKGEERGPDETYRGVRRHEVRTHYAHRRIGVNCEHAWVRNDYADNEQWECSKCGGLRFLKRQHLRGDGAVGFVTKKYVVKP